MTCTTISRRAFAASLAAFLAMPAPLLARAAEPPPTAKRFLEKIYGAYLGSAQKGASGVQLDTPTFSTSCGNWRTISRTVCGSILRELFS